MDLQKIFLTTMTYQRRTYQFKIIGEDSLSINVLSYTILTRTYLWIMETLYIIY